MKRVHALAVLASIGACTQQASAVDLKAGDWTVNVGGIVNAYYTGVSCSGETVGGLALGGRALGCGGEDHRTTIGNGLLPNGLVTSATTKQSDFDIKAHIGIYHATATDSAIAQNSEVDVRQAYFSFGNADIGTFKLGRDNGIFGANAIFGDMTLIGAGAPVQATQRGRVSLGHIGAGYAYVGYYGQMAYSSPKLSGFGVDAGARVGERAVAPCRHARRALHPGHGRSRALAPPAPGSRCSRPSCGSPSGSAACSRRFLPSRSSGGSSIG